MKAKKWEKSGLLRCFEGRKIDGQKNGCVAGVFNYEIREMHEKKGCGIRDA